MAEHSNIEWTQATWNPVTGCTLVSEGCRHCYAAKLAATRLKSHPSRKGLARANADGQYKFTGEVRFNEQWLDQPLRWRRPRMVFVCAHGDLFHHAVPEEWIDRVFAVMAVSGHTFQVLTKRPERARKYLNNPDTPDRIAVKVYECGEEAGQLKYYDRERKADGLTLRTWPLPNVWLGTSVEDQATADERIPHLLNTPAHVRFVSYEPALGPVDFTRICLVPQKPGSYRVGIHIDALSGHYYESGVAYTGDWDIDGPCPPDSERLSLDWIIAGGESGQKARPPHPDWFRTVRDQCAAAGVPFFFKQWGEWAPWDETSEWNPQRGCALTNDGRACSDARDINRDPLNTEYWLMQRVGKKAAGAMLDGREHREFPDDTAIEAAS